MRARLIDLLRRYCLLTGSDDSGGGGNESVEELTITPHDVSAVGRLRQHLGICPQYDVLFQDLSALEHACVASRHVALRFVVASCPAAL